MNDLLVFCVAAVIIAMIITIIIYASKLSSLRDEIKNMIGQHLNKADDQYVEDPKLISEHIASAEKLMKLVPFDARRYFNSISYNLITMAQRNGEKLEECERRSGLDEKYRDSLKQKVETLERSNAKLTAIKKVVEKKNKKEKPLKPARVKGAK